MDHNAPSQTRGAVVVGIDGSPAGQQALRWALTEARLRSASLRVVHAWTFGYANLPIGDLASMGSIVPYPASGLAVSDIRQAAEGVVERAVAELAGDIEGVQIEQRVVEGAAAAVLIGAVCQDDLLVVGSRGHGGFTGTSLLVDKGHRTVIALLTNRVNPSRDGNDATGLRKAVSDVVHSFAP